MLGRDPTNQVDPAHGRLSPEQRGQTHRFLAHLTHPKPPPGLLKASRQTWDSWFRAWWAAHWTPENLPQIRTAIKLFDAFERGDTKAATELRQWMDSIGVTPYAQKRLRWLPPKEDETKATPQSTYRDLRVIGE